MARKHEVDPDKYIDPRSIPERESPPDMFAVAMLVPSIVNKFNTSFIKQHEEKPDWSLYKVELRGNNPFIVREMCDRCGKVFITPKWRKLRSVDIDDIGTVYFETGVCKDCINASIYVDKYLDGVPLDEKDAKALFYEYASEYEKAWRMVLAAAPRIILSEREWQARCEFFNGCAMCGGPIETRAKYFPIFLNGTHSPWNVIPLCADCQRRHYAGRVNKSKEVKRYKVFSTHEQFQKSKEIRLYLLNEMDKYDIYREPLMLLRKRFIETKKVDDRYL